MITRAVKVRLILFAVLSGVGIAYAGANYLGAVDAILGRGYLVHAELPASGGLYEGAAVTYRGVVVGEVGDMAVTDYGVRVALKIEEGWEIPVDSDARVYNQSAVGEQYLDLQPRQAEGEVLEDGAVIPLRRASVPLAEERLLRDLSRFIESVDRKDLRTVVDELGKAFDGTGPDLQRLIDNGNRLVAAAQRNLPETVRLLEDGAIVLATQKKNSSNIESFMHDLAELTTTLRRSDSDIRKMLGHGPPAARNLNDLLRSVEPTMPVLLANLISVEQVVVVRLDALEQLLVTFPRMISTGFSGVTPDGFGRTSLQMTHEPEPCRKGFLPPHRWRSPTDTSDGKIYRRAHCAEGPPKNMRGPSYAPRPGSGDRQTSGRAAPYDPISGQFTTHDGHSYVLGSKGGQQSLLGDDSWKWLLIGPAVSR